MTNFGRPGDVGGAAEDPERQPTREEVADALEDREQGTAKERLKAARKDSAARGNRKR